MRHCLQLVGRQSLPLYRLYHCTATCGLYCTSHLRSTAFPDLVVCLLWVKRGPCMLKTFVTTFAPKNAAVAARSALSGHRSLCSALAT